MAGGVRGRAETHRPLQANTPSPCFLPCLPSPGAPPVPPSLPPSPQGSPLALSGVQGLLCQQAGALCPTGLSCRDQEQSAVI